MFMKNYAPNRCLYIKVAKLRNMQLITGVGTYKITVSKYSKSTAGILPKKVNKKICIKLEKRNKKMGGGGGGGGGGRGGGVIDVNQELKLL